ncbi:MAG: ABC transporter permease subunit [Candidatus Cloacimonadales bacterium]
MSYTKTIAAKEFKGYFTSPAAYILMTIFLIITGWFFANPLFLINQADLRTMFSVIPWIFIVLIPATTMGLLAKERESGTLELLATFPMAKSQIIMGKFWAALGLLAVGLLFTFVHFFTILFLGTNVDLGAILCGYLGLIFLAALYSAIGIFASSLTQNQIVAFIISFFIIMILYLMQFALFFIPDWLAGFMQYLSVEYHFSNLAKGVIDTRNVIYFLSGTILFLKLATTTLDSKS